METIRPRRWERPQHYMGDDWSGWLSAGVGRSRDSDVLERANFDAMLKACGGESDTVVVVREHHWAVGWVEWIAISPRNSAAWRACRDALKRLDAYPILDDDLFNEYENEECAATWDFFDWRQRLEYLREHARHECAGNFAMILAAVRGDWWSAANLLPCPSDILC